MNICTWVAAYENHRSARLKLEFFQICTATIMSALLFRVHDWYKPAMTEPLFRITSRSEYRFMLIAATICIIVVIAALAWTQSDDSPTPSTTTIKQRSIFKIPPKPVAATSQKSEELAPDQITPEALPVIHPAVALTPVQRPGKAAVIRGYYIQSGAFQDPNKARRWREKLQKKGWKGTIVNRKKGLHAVWLGPWLSRTDADSAKARLMRTLKIQGFIIRK